MAIRRAGVQRPRGGIPAEHRGGDRRVPPLREHGRDLVVVLAGLPFDHPLWLLYSSGTTGLPKPIVHGQGGILLEHLKTMHLHLDAGERDRIFWFTTAGWMTWNVLGSALLTPASVVLYDGNPGHPDLNRLWDLAEERVGKLARPKRIVWADGLPKTRSGKIMRRLLRDLAEGRPLGDLTTLRPRRWSHGSTRASGSESARGE